VVRIFFQSRASEISGMKSESAAVILAHSDGKSRLNEPVLDDAGNPIQGKLPGIADDENRQSRNQGNDEVYEIISDKLIIALDDYIMI